jgi:hypothetical protein
MSSLASQDTPRGRALLFRLLLDATLLAVSPGQPDKPRTFTLTRDTPLRLLTTSRDGETALPLFTDPSALSRAFPQGAGYVAVPARVLFELAAADGTDKVLLNPGSPTGGYLTRTEITALARGRLPLGATEVVADRTPVRLARPARPLAAEAVVALREAVEAEPSASRAWYFLLQQGPTEPEMAVAVQFAEGIQHTEQRRAMRAIVEAAGLRCNETRGYIFLAAGPDLQNSLGAGSGVELFRRGVL